MTIDAERRARFERIAAEAYEPIRRYLHRRATSDDADDALAETLLVIWRRLDDVPEHALPYCYGVARRCLANLRRGNARRTRLAERVMSVTERGDLLDPQLIVDAADPALAGALAQLTDAEAEVVRLWAWEQLEPRHIAEVMAITPNAASVALARAKRKLADQLARQEQARSGHLLDARMQDREGGER